MDQMSSNPDTPQNAFDSSTSRSDDLPICDDPMRPIIEPLEIERKFLVTHLPEDLHLFSHKHIEQGYLAVIENGMEVRLRRQGDTCSQTVKSQGNLIRSEWEIELTYAQFIALWPATDGKRLEKTRYSMPHEGLTIILDVYHNALEGLYVSEVEFISLEESQAFVPPVWFGLEVTNDKRYKNKNLARFGMPDLLNI